MNCYAVYLELTQYCKSTILQLKKMSRGLLLVVQWLRTAFQCRGYSLIPGWGTKIPYAAGQQSPQAASAEPMHSGAHVPQLQMSVCYNEDPAPPK